MHRHVDKPVPIRMPDFGAWVAESAHGASFRMGVEQHDFHQIYVVQRGQITVKDERVAAPLVMDAGAIWPIPAGVRHTMEDSSESMLLLVCVSQRYLDGIGSRRALWEDWVARTDQPIRPDTSRFLALVARLNRVLAEQWQRQAGYALVVRSELDQLLVWLGRSRDTDGGKSAEERVRRLVAVIDMDFYEGWDIERAASHVHLSRRRFTTLFKRATGATFNAYLTRRRLDHAMSLLAEGHHSIAGAAFACGIGDISHFYRLFKAHTGQTPAGWMARHGEAGPGHHGRIVSAPADGLQ